MSRDPHRFVVDIGDERDGEADPADDQPAPSEVTFQREGGARVPRDDRDRVICKRPSSWELPPTLDV